MDSAPSIRSITPILHLRTPSLSTTLKSSLIPPPSPLSFPSHLHVTISKTLLSNPPIGSHVRVKASFNSIPRSAGSSPNPLNRCYPPRRRCGRQIPQREMEAGKDGEALEIVKKLVSAQPEETVRKFLMVRMLSEMGSTRDARDVSEEILKLNPLDFEALFENALLMDGRGEGEAVVSQLEEALMVMEEGDKVSEARDVKLIMAPIRFLQKNVDEALRRYENTTCFNCALGEVLSNARLRKERSNCSTDEACRKSEMEISEMVVNEMIVHEQLCEAAMRILKRCK
ncbi:hypothetical protein RHSIM_Rhsim06G0167700 [Rhododendron simsii]|uniref:Uncharacterized protein n=1 Tax=Rhododendron simsii TaxID=118357 RepID=A0A834GVW8_RHOSS|nr:hypothetical protein RHSIM_Rhsim06G0167700 [Rhododendron simsii]